MKWPKFDKFDLKAKTILLGYMGSISHGTYLPPKDKNGIDDKDVMGICVPPHEYYYGLQKFEQYVGFVEEYDITIYEIKKMFNLLLKSNPNVLGLLWLPENLYIKTTEQGKEIIKNRDLFVSKQAYKSFIGYAYSQLHKMTHLTFQGYMGEKRKAIVNKYGYDTKNAAHLIRLLRTGMEFLTSGELNVYRHDKQQLIEIKSGEYTLKQIKEMSNDLMKKTEEAYIKSTLPAQPKREEAEKLLIKIIKSINKDSK